MDEFVALVENPIQPPATPAPTVPGLANPG
jgi:hypothetical protein